MNIVHFLAAKSSSPISPPHPSVRTNFFYTFDLPDIEEQVTFRRHVTKNAGRSSGFQGPSFVPPCFEQDTSRLVAGCATAKISSYAQRLADLRTICAAAGRVRHQARSSRSFADGGPCERCLPPPLAPTDSPHTRPWAKHLHRQRPTTLCPQGPIGQLEAGKPRDKLGGRFPADSRVSLLHQS